MSDHENHEARRGIDFLAALLTSANLFFGYVSILSSARGTVADMDIAAKAIGWAVLFDGLDGRVARLRKTASLFGKEFDSLADVISFGIAPAFLALVWGLRGLEPAASKHPEFVQHIYQIGWIVTFLFVICGAWRLARFNIHSAPVGNPGLPAHRDFVGIPIPAAAGLIAAIVHFRQQPIADWRWGAAWVALVAGLALLMVSPIRFHSLKEVTIFRRRTTMVITFGLVACLIWWYSRVVLLVIAIIYLLSGLLGQARRRLMGHPA